MNQTLKTILLSALVFIVMAVFFPLSWLDVGVGTVSLTSLSGTDQLSDFPTFFNAQLALLNNGKVDVASTTWPQLTTASGLASIGTITTGVWNGTAITAAFGGTGSTTLSANQVLLGNGTGNIGIVSGFGSSGQSLVSNGAGSAPTWQTVSFDLNANYNPITGNWNHITGAHRIQNLHASGTAANPFTINGTPTNWGGFTSATGSIFAWDGSARVSVVPFDDISSRGRFLAATTTNEAATVAGETTYGNGTLHTLSGGTLGTSGAIRVRAFVTTLSDSGGDGDAAIELELGGTTVCTTGTLSNVSNTSRVGWVEFVLYSDGSESAQVCHTTGLITDSTFSVNYRFFAESTSSVDTSTDQNIDIIMDWISLGTDQTENITIDGAQVEFLGRLN